MLSARLLRSIAALSMIAALAACATNIMEKEIRPRLDAGLGMTFMDLQLRLGPPDTPSATAPAWINSYERQTRVPIQAYRNGKWVTVNHRIDTTNVSCTIRAETKDDVVTALTASGAPTACRQPARLIAGG